MIELKHVSRNFNNTVAVDDLNFKLSSGETLGIIGQNGSINPMIILKVVDLPAPF